VSSAFRARFTNDVEEGRPAALTPSRNSRPSAFHVSPAAFGVSCPAVKSTNPSCSFFSRQPCLGWALAGGGRGGEERNEKEKFAGEDPTDDSQEIGCFYFARFSLVLHSAAPSPAAAAPRFFSSVALRMAPCNPTAHSSLIRAMNRACDGKIEAIPPKTRDGCSIFRTVIQSLPFYTTRRITRFCSPE